MSLEKQLKRIADALEQIATAPTTSEAEPETEEPGPDTDDLLGLDDNGDDEITIDKLREKLKEFVNEKSAADAQAMLKKFKAKKLSDVKEKDYEKLYKALEKAL